MNSVISKILLLLLVCSICFMAQAQTFQHIEHARQIATSDNSPVLWGATAQYANPAATAHNLDGWDFTTAMSSRYSTDILAGSAALAKSFNNSAIGLLVGSYGIDGFKENQLSLSFARSIGKHAYLGIQANAYQIQVEGFGQSTIADLTLGYWQLIDEKIIISASIKNPAQLTNDDRRISGKADIGLGYIISDKLEIFTSVDKSWDAGWSVRPGLRYTPHQVLRVFFSTDTSPSAISLGLGLQLDTGLTADLGINTHPILGNSLALSLGYLIQK